MNQIFFPFKIIGNSLHKFIRELGKMGCFFANALFYMLFPPYLFRRIIKQINFIGVKTVLVIVLTGTFTGMVLALQMYYVLIKFGAEARLGPAVAMSLIKELGPVICALMVTGRAGSAITAEIGIMRISEQVDALDAMALNPYKYLIIPNIIAGVISLPLLNAIFVVLGVFGGYAVGVGLMGVSSGTYFGGINDFVAARDVFEGFYKSLSFGVLITWISCYKGFYTGYGAEGVSKATTQSVVISSVVILIWDYFMTSLLVA
ncbi:toluene transporter subunit: membrane component of ABC superfamily [Candidatus Kuenenia stuttgartiensis]|jgi:phospholipid/cholesterol/gamma-HCH transport system permease protein|uniref:Strongly similar to ABC-transporter, permease n=1 Tax=Kuenenia stuttgartiensis TaxID=174633 RepID=Q1Q298_KUEST|nr:MULTISPECIES: MlaE family lipid ABC transporter permease subunit [Kuenenia]MBE7548770.1 ABC transporter permease [Planctomycetia bacterium]MBZ0191255.1 MlaE family lipid ABC transporter permease subunit [Candidatus Kuenenia stuttgartiensis]MCF6150877.1 ABC transporter permease [Candidatus Kuenenia stuttgartiensis]MCL4727716.1 ABC transporter permease [Candidatus Kuenenia stuttgartiensis]MCZ7622273.1 MlaE family lipid ABC transporter permease subunit [Candidatus Kuenenia sp.]